MPYPSQFTREQLIETARTLFELHGYEAVSMAQVAGALGIKASSLYKHVSDKNALLQEVNTLTLQELNKALEAVVQEGTTPYAQCLAMGRAYYEFGLAHPTTYELAFMRQYNATLDSQVNDRLALPLQSILDDAIGEEASLDALRGAWAFLHGTVSLLLGDHFRRAGAFDYERAWSAYLAGWGITPEFTSKG
jgi:AcrR family transcriptional regulator